MSAIGVLDAPDRATRPQRCAAVMAALRAGYSDVEDIVAACAPFTRDETVNALWLLSGERPGEGPIVHADGCWRVNERWRWLQLPLALEVA